jgi:hypothetical protein
MGRRVSRAQSWSGMVVKIILTAPAGNQTLVIQPISKSFLDARMNTQVYSHGLHIVCSLIKGIPVLVM